MFRITFSNSDAVAESDDGRLWYIRTGYSTYQLPDQFGATTVIEDTLFLKGYNVNSISVVSGENIFSFKVAEGSPRRWEVIREEFQCSTVSRNC